MAATDGEAVVGWSPEAGPQVVSRATIYSAAVPEPVTIIGGSGALGFGMAARLGAAGVPIVIGSRDPARAEETVRRLAEKVPEGSFSGDANGPAAERAEIVLLSVPFRNQSETLTNLKNHLRPEQLLIDGTVPLAAAVSGRATRTLGVWQGSAAQQAAEMVPDGVRVVSALHTVNAAMCADLDHSLDEDVLICGDRRADKRQAAELIQRIPGLRCVDCGRLEQARITEQLTALLIGMNGRYKARTGIRIVGLPDELWPRPS
jgi:NADPH-dependent F420 reductase